MKGGILSIKSPIYNVSLFELLKTYSTLKMQKGFQTINIPKLPVFTAEEGAKQIKNNLQNIEDWEDLIKLVPESFYQNSKMKKTGIAGIFAASLELTKEGIIQIMQKKMFDKILIKKTNG